jgi:hypothetical protein
MTIKKFLSKYEDLAKELVRCGGCSNILLHCDEKYTIVKIGDNEEGVLCETSQQNNRNIELVTKILDDNINHVFQIPVSQLDNNNNNIVKQNKQQEK